MGITIGILFTFRVYKMLLKLSTTQVIDTTTAVLYDKGTNVITITGGGTTSIQDSGNAKWDKLYAAAA